MANGARRRREVERQREARKRRSHEAQSLQAQAVARKDLQRRKRHRIEAGVLFALGAIIAVTHGFEHAGSLRFVSQNVADLF